MLFMGALLLIVNKKRRHLASWNVPEALTRRGRWADVLCLVAHALHHDCVLIDEPSPARYWAFQADKYDMTWPGLPMECVVDTGSSAYVAKINQNAAAVSAHNMPAAGRG
jgi:hypothetical protein